MVNIPNPILIFGDVYTSKNTIISAKNKYSEARWVTKSASTESLDDIRMEAGLSSWDDSEKILLIQDIPNKKQVREFLVDLSNNCPQKTKIIIWDSNNHIKIDKETQNIEKTWLDFVSSIKSIKGAKIINNGDELTEKTSDDCYEFISKRFAKYNKKIDNKEIKLLISIVGYDRGMLESDIDKMCLTCPDKVDSRFIIDNAFPLTQEAVLYKLNNVVDDGNYEDTLNMIDKFLESGINANIIAEVFVKKARWQMAVASLWNSGMAWQDIPNKLIEMGKFPSSLWYSQEIDPYQKKKDSEIFKDQSIMVEYLNKKEGVPLKYFKKPSKEETKAKSKKKNAETIPMYFMASQIVDFVRTKIVIPNQSKEEKGILKRKVVNRAIWVYTFMQDKLSEIRYGNNPEQNLNEMAKVLNGTSIESF